MHVISIIQRVIFNRLATPASSAICISRKYDNKPSAYNGAITKYAYTTIKFCRTSILAKNIKPIVNIAFVFKYIFMYKDNNILEINTVAILTMVFISIRNAILHSFHTNQM